jgi:hypothetical protein
MILLREEFPGFDAQWPRSGVVSGVFNNHRARVTISALNDSRPDFG